MSKNFNDLDEVKIAEYSENIFHEYLLSKGIKPFTPKGKGSHDIDGYFFHNDKLYGFDVKCKNKRIYYDDVGFDKRDFNKYNDYIKNRNMIVLIVFIIPDKGIMTCNDIQKLVYDNKNKFLTYPKIEVSKNKKHSEEVIYFHLNSLKKIKDLNEEEKKYIEQYQNSKYIKKGN